MGQTWWDKYPKIMPSPAAGPYPMPGSGGVMQGPGMGIPPLPPQAFGAMPPSLGGLDPSSFAGGGFASDKLLDRAAQGAFRRRPGRAPSGSNRHRPIGRRGNPKRRRSEGGPGAAAADELGKSRLRSVGSFFRSGTGHSPESGGRLWAAGAGTPASLRRPSVRRARPRRRLCGERDWNAIATFRPGVRASESR